MSGAGAGADGYRVLIDRLRPRVLRQKARRQRVTLLHGARDARFNQATGAA